jgi:hypothetical protein
VVPHAISREKATARRRARATVAALRMAMLLSWVARRDPRERR